MVCVEFDAPLKDWAGIISCQRVREDLALLDVVTQGCVYDRGNGLLPDV